MEPIVSPWLFYLAEVSKEVGSFCGGALMILVAFICLSPIIAGIIDDIGYETKGVKLSAKIAAILIAICLIVTAILPSEKTIYKMIIAKNITPNNIEKVENGAKGVVDYIVESVDKLMKDEDNNEKEGN